MATLAEVRKSSTFKDSYERALSMIRASGGAGVSESQLMIAVGYSTSKQYAIRHAMLELNPDIIFDYAPSILNNWENKPFQSRDFDNPKRFYVRAAFEEQAERLRLRVKEMQTLNPSLAK